MKYCLMTLLCICMVFVLIPSAALAESKDTAIDAVNFPDDNFRSYVKASIDISKDGVLSEQERTAVKTVKVEEMDIISLKGIEYFTKITELDCDNNKLAALDVSGNADLVSLHCDFNRIETLNVSENAKLSNLTCFYNSLTELDVSKNTSLKYLDCTNNKLSRLDISKNTQLSYLSCGNSDAHPEFGGNKQNKIPILDVSGNPDLESLWCNGIGIASLNVCSNPKLASLYCSQNNLTALDVSQNNELVDLDFRDNSLKTIDLSRNAKLKVLYCYNNNLTALDVSSCANLEMLGCSINSITTLDVSSCSNLRYLYCESNEFSALDVSSNSSLLHLHCGHNKLTALDVSRNGKLTDLLCYGNNLTTLDVSRNSALSNLDLSDNSLTTLDVSRNSALTNLNLSDNSLTTLDVSRNTVLESLLCDNNSLTALDLKNNSRLSWLYCENNHLSSLDLSNTEISTNGPNSTCHCGGNIKYIDAADGKYDLNSLNETGFIFSRASQWLNGSNLFTPSIDTPVDIEDGIMITYVYDCGRGIITTFGLYPTLTTVNNHCIITYDANGGNGSMNSIKVNLGAAISLSKCDFIAPEGKQFCGWAVDSPDGEKYGYSHAYTVTKDTTFYALWCDIPKQTVQLLSKPNNAGRVLSIGVANVDITSGKLSYRINGGAYETRLLTLNTDIWAGQIELPDITAEINVEYIIELKLAFGSSETMIGPADYIIDAKTTSLHLGNVSDDGKSEPTEDDAILITDVYLEGGKSATQTLLADVNCDGVADTEDALFLKLMLR